MNFEEKLKELGLTLPKPPQAAGAYVPTVRAGSLLFVSGQLPYVEGAVKYQGKVGRELTVEDGYQAARTCALNSLAQIKAELGTLDSVRKLVRVVGFVNCGEDFPDQPKVVNGASDLFLAVFGERGKHTRLALGSNSLPRNAAVELEVLVEV